MKHLLSSLLLTFLSTQAFSQIPSYVDTTGLIGWYSFTGNANDDSIHANNGIVSVKT